MKFSILSLSSAIAIIFCSNVLAADINVHVTKVIHEGCVYKKTVGMHKKRLICDDENQVFDQGGGRNANIAANGQNENSNQTQYNGNSGNTKGSNNGYGNGTDSSPGGSNNHIANNGNR